MALMNDPRLDVDENGIRMEIGRTSARIAAQAGMERLVKFRPTSTVH
jgi:hypothetical protein